MKMKDSLWVIVLFIGFRYNVERKGIHIQFSHVIIAMFNTSFCTCNVMETRYGRDPGG